MTCLETTFLIDILRGNPAVSALKDDLDRTETSLCIAAPSVMELWSGACLAHASAAEKEKVLALIESLEVLELDERSAREAGEIEAELVNKGLRTQTEDILIAGIARSTGRKLVTRDAGYARVPGLKLLKY
jgi:tRNA(fMet)-specific endonuclease VapC